MKEFTPAQNRLLQVFVLFVGIVLLISGVVVALRREVERKLAEIRASEMPATVEELDRWYVLPAGETNAADLYAEAFRVYRQPTREQEKLLPGYSYTNYPPVGIPVSVESLKVMQDYLADNTDTLRLLHKASSVKHCRYPLNLSQGGAVILPHVGKLRQLARLLALQAESAASNSNASSCAGAILDGMAVGESLRTEPLLLSQAVRSRCGVTTMSALERALSAGVLQDADLARLIPALAAADEPQAMMRAIIGERCVRNYSFDRPISYFQWRGWAARVGLWVYQATGLRDLDRLCYLDLMAEYLNAWQFDRSEGWKTIASLNSRASALPRYALVTREISSPISNVIPGEFEYSARLRLAQVAIAAERHRLKHGQWPAELVAPVLADPFDGKPLRYRRTATGFVLWSVGKNGKDDGGLCSRSGGTDPDIVFTVDRSSVK